MKKALLALSIAAGLTGVAQAENATTLYGSLGVEVQTGRNAEPLGAALTNNRNSWDLQTETAKIGVKGTEDLQNGLQAFYKYEFEFTGDNNDGNSGLDQTRYAYVGLRGDWGTLTLGKQDAVYKLVTGYNDIFEDNYWGDFNHFQTLTAGDRIAKVISYVSPDYYGFKGAIAGILDGSHTVNDNSTSRGFSGAQAGIWYDQNGFYAGVSYSWLSNGRHKNTVGGGSVNVFGGAVGYSNDQFKVGFGVENANAFSQNVGQKYNLAGEYYYGPNTFRAGLGFSHTNMTEFDTDDLNAYVDKAGDNSKANIWTVALGYQYNFSQRTYSWVEGEYINYASEIKNNSGEELSDGYLVRVGLRHDF